MYFTVHDRYALTAAHCVANRLASSTRLRVGVTQTTTATSSYNTFSVSLFKVHASYNSANGLNDIALVRTTNPIQFSTVASPVCLPYRQRAAALTFADNWLTLAGWGTVEFGGPQSTTLLKTTVKGVNSASCASTYPAASNSAAFLCTYFPDRDGCQMDSGSNVIYNYAAGSYSKLYSVGIISGGNGCGGPSPSLNVRVTSYLDWIEENSSDAFYCQA